MELQNISFSICPVYHSNSMIYPVSLERDRLNHSQSHTILSIKKLTRSLFMSVEKESPSEECAKCAMRHSSS